MSGADAALWPIGNRPGCEVCMKAPHARAQLVGIAAYEEAGGTIMRDLFTLDQGGWMQDVALLDRMVAESLGETAHEVVKEGWKWIEAAADLPYSHEYGHRRITGTTDPLSEAEQAACDVLMAEFDRLTDEYDGDDDLPEEVDVRLGELEAAIDRYPVIGQPLQRVSRR